VRGQILHVRHRRHSPGLDDGWTWRSGVRPLRSGMAPDLIHIGDRYYMYIARNVGAQPKAEINMIWSKTLDPNSPDYKWEEADWWPRPTASKIAMPSTRAPSSIHDGRLWLTYGSYFGYIRLVELDPKTGKRLNPTTSPATLPSNCEASDMMYHDGWYYLTGHARQLLPRLRLRLPHSLRPREESHRSLPGRHGVDMIEGGGEAAHWRGRPFCRCGHFGLLDLGKACRSSPCTGKPTSTGGGAERARYPSAAVEGRLARGRRETRRKACMK